MKKNLLVRIDKTLKKNIRKQTKDTPRKHELMKKNSTEQIIPIDFPLQESNNFIMKDEQRSRQALAVATNNYDEVMFSEIPDEEKAVDDDAMTNELEKAWEKMNIPSVLGMRNIKNVCNDSLYALVYTDKKGVRYIKFCQQYKNGTFSPPMTIAQSDLLMVSLSKSANADDKEDAAIKRKSSIFKAKIVREYLGVFCGMPDDVLKINEILNSLLYALPNLSTFSEDETEYRRRDFYNTVIEIVKEFPTQAFSTQKSYYALTDEEIGWVAQKLRMDRIGLLKKLREYGFLYTTSSEKGYQANIRFKYPDGETYTERRYCIRRLDYYLEAQSAPEQDYDF